MMPRHDYVLAVLAAGQGAAHTPVQLQKLFFLLDRNLWSDPRRRGPYFDFRPYDYGPFDPAIYDELRSLAEAGLVEIESRASIRWHLYRTSQLGQREGESFLSELPQEVSGYIRDLSAWVRRVPFAELLGYVYRRYPDMAVNSVFHRPHLVGRADPPDRGVGPRAGEGDLVVVSSGLFPPQPL